MKVLMATRRSAVVTLGGDTIQIRSLSRELERLGCEVQLDVDGEVSAVGFDLVHLFNIDRPQDIIASAIEAKRNHIPVVLTPIFVDYREFDTRGRLGIPGKIARMIGADWTERGKVLVRGVKNGEFHSGSLPILFPVFFLFRRRCWNKLIFSSPIQFPKWNACAGILPWISTPFDGKRW